ncbi:MAG: hypothetical protein AB7V50_10720 [Vampirovibrionia bacterium]
MVKIGKGKLVDSNNSVVKESIMLLLEKIDSNSDIRAHFNYNCPKQLHNIRSMLMDKFEINRYDIVFTSNNILKEIIEEVVRLEETILLNHLIDLTKNNSEFLMNLRAFRANLDIQKVLEEYEKQHAMTKCSIKKGIYICSEDSIFAIIDQL